MALCQTRPKLCFLAIPRQLSLFNNQLKKDTIIYLPRSDVFHERRTESFQQAENPSCSERRHKASAYRRGGEVDDKSQGIIRAGARTRTYRGGATTSRATAGKEAHKRAHGIDVARCVDDKSQNTQTSRRKSARYRGGATTSATAGEEAHERSSERARIDVARSTTRVKEDERRRK